MNSVRPWLYAEATQANRAVHSAGPSSLVIWLTVRDFQMPRHFSLDEKLA